MRQISNDNDSYSQELARLDTMLIAERIVDRYPNEQLNNNSIEIEHPEYQANLTRIRHFYHDELAKFDKNSNDFCTHVITLLHQQSQIRPISSEEITHMISMVRKKLCLIQIQLKQNTCEAVMNLRTRFLDARYLEKKRKSFYIQSFLLSFLDVNDVILIKQHKKYLMNIFILIYQILIHRNKLKKN
jgi:hypothetical protein